MHKLNLDQRAAWRGVVQYSVGAWPCFAPWQGISPCRNCKLQAALSSNHDLAMLGSASSKRMIDGQLLPRLPPSASASTAAWPPNQPSQRASVPASQLPTQTFKVATCAKLSMPPQGSSPCHDPANCRLSGHTAYAANGSLCRTLAAWSASRDAAVLLCTVKHSGRTPSICHAIHDAVSSQAAARRFWCYAISRSCLSCLVTGRLIKTAENRGRVTTNLGATWLPYVAATWQGSYWMGSELFA